MTTSNYISKKKNNFSTEKRKKLMFFIITSAPFILQVCIFYIYVNLSNFALGFQQYTMEEGVGIIGHFSGLDNFKNIIDIIATPEKIKLVYNSLLFYAFVLFVSTPLSIIFSFYIYKKFFLSGFFKVILFLPQVISTVVMTLLYKYMLNDVYCELTGDAYGLVNKVNPDTAKVLFFVIVYNLWMGFGGNILLYSGAMSGINESIVESCQLDGCNIFQEFWHITMPSVYPTFITFIIIDISSIFVNSMNLYTFFGQTAEDNIGSIGYYMFVQVTNSPGLVANKSGFLSYPELSAMGLLITIIILPIVLIVRFVLQKVGPKED